MSRVTMLDVARASGVSKNTVSLALRGDPQIPEQTRGRIRAQAERMGYRKNPTVAHLMARLRTEAAAGHRASLGLVNANNDREAFRRHPTIPTYVAGIRRRAAELGYDLDTFWLGDPALGGRRLQRILKTRGIRGLILVGRMESNRLPPGFETVWNTFPAVVTGVRTRDPALSFACTDHHLTTLRAVEKARGLGYRRPGLVLDRRIHELVEGRFEGGFRVGQEALPRKNRLRSFHHEPDATIHLFRKWLEREQPDVILTLYNKVRTWLGRLGRSVPDTVGLIQLEWRRDLPDWAGMDQHNDLAGAAAVDLLVGMIHDGTAGVPAYPRATLIGPSWVDGATVRPSG